MDFEVTIPGEGKDRIFKVSIRWLAKVSWRLLQETLVSGRLQVPLDSVQALDVAMRHLASMRYRTVANTNIKKPYEMDDQSYFGLFSLLESHVSLKFLIVSPQICTHSAVMLQ